MSNYIGTSGWSYDHWKGHFYPGDLAKHRWFDYYASQFDAVEVNATFYRRFNDDVYRKWRDQAPDGFRYVLKAPRLISHRHHLIHMEEEIRDFERSCCLLHENLGLILLQLPPSMPYEPDRLKNILLSVDDPSRIAVEFRHTRWITDESISLLTDFGAVYCNSDNPEHSLSTYLTGVTGYLRLHGRREWYADSYTDNELVIIASQVREIFACGAQDIYIFFNNDFNAFAPANAVELRHILDR